MFWNSLWIVTPMWIKYSRRKIQGHCIQEEFHFRMIWESEIISVGQEIHATNALDWIGSAFPI